MSIKKPLNHKKILRKSPASNAKASVFKNPVYCPVSLHLVVGEEACVFWQSRELCWGELKLPVGPHEPDKLKGRNLTKLVKRNMFGMQGHCIIWRRHVNILYIARQKINSQYRNCIFRNSSQPWSTSNRKPNYDTNEKQDQG